MNSKRMVLWQLGWLALGLCSQASAWAGSDVTFGPAGAPNWSMEKWTATFRQAPKAHSFKGVFIVSMPSVASVASSRITHVVRRGDVVERIEALTGQQRITFRHNNEVMTFFPDAKVVRHEQLAPGAGAFPGAGEKFKASSAQYQVIPGGRSRIAGYETYAVDFRPVDQWRFGYRIWSDIKTGLVLKLQTMAGASVIEQSEFSELTQDVSADANALVQEMKQIPSGYKMVRAKAQSTSAASEGWTVGALPDGFEMVTCYKRAEIRSLGWLQCVFSDGMASASIFLERYDPSRHRQEGQMAMGATHTLVKRMVDAHKQEWWATVVGEVPIATLRAISESMARAPDPKTPR